MTVKTDIEWTASLSDLLNAYSRIKTRDYYQPLHMKRAPVYSLEDAVKRLREMVGVSVNWQVLSSYIPSEWLSTPTKRKSALASHFSAMLELVKQGDAEIRQDDTFGPIELRAARTEAHA